MGYIAIDITIRVIQFVVDLMRYFAQCFQLFSANTVVRRKILSKNKLVSCILLGYSRRLTILHYCHASQIKKTANFRETVLW